MNLDDFHLSDDALDSLLEQRNPYLSEPRRALELVVRLAGAAAPRAPALRTLEALVATGLPALAAASGVPVAPDLLEALRATVDAIAGLVAFPGLANRNVVGVGGAFSAGKSRFLNSLAGTALLPEDLGPCTVIPTYLGHGPAQAVALTTFGRTVPMDDDALAAVSHAFTRSHALGADAADGLSHLVRLLMVTHAALPWQRVVFLDTPGYNPPGREGEQGDADVARHQLAAADHLVWLVNARNGGLRADDIAFLRAAQPREPVFFVLTQADLVAASAIDALLDGVRTAAGAAGIACAGAMAWSAPPGLAHGRPCGGDDIHTWLDQVDGAMRYPALGRRCAVLVDRYVLHCRRELAREQAMLAGLNELQVLAGTPFAGRHAQLDAEMRRLRQGQAGRDALLPRLDAFRRELLDAVSTLLGAVIVDEPPGGKPLLLECARADVGVGTALPLDCMLALRVVAVRADLKHVQAVFLDHDAALQIPFSRIRQCWGIDPLAVGVHSELTARLVQAGAERLTFAIHHHNEPQASA